MRIIDRAAQTDANAIDKHYSVTTKLSTINKCNSKIENS